MNIITTETDIDGTINYFLNGVRHRDNGPAIEASNGGKVWYIHGQLHRIDGPAIITHTGGKYWYLNNKEYTSIEFLLKTGIGN